MGSGLRSKGRQPLSLGGARDASEGVPYTVGMEFPELPTDHDVKALRRQVAHDRFGVVDGGEKPSVLRVPGRRTRAAKDRSPGSKR